jgi:hypothetical protein
MSKDIVQVGPLQRGRIKGYEAAAVSDVMAITDFALTVG